MNKIKNYLHEDEVIFAVYGTLKKNRGNHRVMGNSTLLGTHKTIPSYTMYDGGFPVVERGGDTPITVEVFKTTDKKTINNIFSLEGCSGEQHSSQNWYDFDLIDTPHGQAVMFVMDKGESSRNKVVESGEW